MDGKMHQRESKLSHLIDPLGGEEEVKQEPSLAGMFFSNLVDGEKE